MTQTGDHGGETVDEIDSALFAFSPSGKFSQADSVASPNCDNGLVHQVNFIARIQFFFIYSTYIYTVKYIQNNKFWLIFEVTYSSTEISKVKSKFNTLFGTIDCFKIYSASR